MRLAWPSSSSAMSMRNFSEIMSLAPVGRHGQTSLAECERRETLGDRPCRQCHEKRCPRARGGLEPDLTAVAVHQTPDGGQAHPFPLGPVGMEALESVKDFLVVGLRNAQAVVLDVTGQHPALGFRLLGA